tara:strand:- start:2190 stop:2639 length:450 start_codon:yes stop_codon:yes gene_type:complete
MIVHDIIIEGNPVPKGRPRFSKFGHAYTPKKTREAESILSGKINIYKLKKNLPIIFEPVEVEIIFFLHRPKYLNNKKYPDGEILHTKKPDLDNLVKTVLDSLNGNLIGDDSQIYKFCAQKYYCGKSQTPHTQIKISYHPEGKLCLKKKT